MPKLERPIPDRGPAFDAEYPGECAAGDEIHRGERVRYVDGELMHTDCED